MTRAKNLRNGSSSEQLFALVGVLFQRNLEIAPLPRFLVNKHPMTRPQVLLLPLVAFLIIPTVSALEPLKESTEFAMAQKAGSAIKRSDKNKDGKIQKEEDERLWKRKARHDKKSRWWARPEELKQISDPQVDSPGKKLLNVIFKRTPAVPRLHHPRTTAPRRRWFAAQHVRFLSPGRMVPTHNGASRWRASGSR